MMPVPGSSEGQPGTVPYGKDTHNVFVTMTYCNLIPLATGHSLLVWVTFSGLP